MEKQESREAGELGILLHVLPGLETKNRIVIARYVLGEEGAIEVMHIQLHLRFRRSALLVAFLLLFWIAFFSFSKAVRAHASVIEAIPA